MLTLVLAEVGNAGSLRAAREAPLPALLAFSPLDFRSYSSFSSNDESLMFLATIFRDDDLTLFELKLFCALTSLAMRLTTLLSSFTFSLFLLELMPTHLAFWDCLSGEGEGTRRFDRRGDLDIPEPGDGDLDVRDELKDGAGELDNLDGGLDKEEDLGDGQTEENVDDEVDVEDIQDFEDVLFFTSD